MYSKHCSFKSQGIVESENFFQRILQFCGKYLSIYEVNIQENTENMAI